MSTKAELMRYMQERSGPKKSKQTRRRRDSPVDTSLPGVSATDRRAGRKAAYALEDSNERPPRSSTLKSLNRLKGSGTLRLVKTNLKRA